MNTYHRERVGQLPVQYVDTIDSIMAVITTLDDVKQVIMFGSCSRGANTENSDIDLLLLLDSEKSGIPFNRLEQKVGAAICERFTFNGKKELDLLFADKKTYTNSTDPKSVYRSVKKDGVILYEQLL